MSSPMIIQVRDLSSFILKSPSVVPIQYRPPESSNKQVARWFRFSSLVTKSKSFLSGFQVSMESAIPTHIVPLIEATVYTFDFCRHENFCGDEIQMVCILWSVRRRIC